MRKRLLDADAQNTSAHGDWLDLSAATAEISSEDPLHPIEAALRLDDPDGPGWRAAAPGPQVVRIVFDEPRRISRIHVVFEERAAARSQEFALAWSSDNGASYREIVRQQWNFSPGGAQTESEDYRVELAGVTALQLTIDPDVSGGGAKASLRRLRVA